MTGKTEKKMQMENDDHKRPDQTHRAIYPQLFLPAGIPVSHLIEKEFQVKLPIGAGHGMKEEAAIQINSVPNDQYLFIELKGFLLHISAAC